MQQYECRVFLDHKGIAACERIQEFYIVAESLEIAEARVLRKVRYDAENLEEFLLHSDDRVLGSVGWYHWRADKWNEGAREINSEYFQGQFREVRFKIRMKPVPQPKPAEVCPTCGRYLDEL